MELDSTVKKLGSKVSITINLQIYFKEWAVWDFDKFMHWLMGLAQKDETYNKSLARNFLIRVKREETVWIHRTIFHLRSETSWNKSTKALFSNLG